MFNGKSCVKILGNLKVKNDYFKKQLRGSVFYTMG